MVAVAGILQGEEVIFLLISSDIDISYTRLWTEFDRYVT